MDATDAQAEREVQARHYWHLEQFIQLGFERHQAEILELANVDWRDADLLLQRGCPLETAILILT